MFPTRRSLVIGLAALAASLAPAFAQENGPPPPGVIVADAVELAMAPTIQVPGTVISRNDAAIAADVSGRVVEIAEVGTSVEAGDVIAQLDSKMLELQVAQDEATVKRLEANLAFLTRDVERFEELAARNATPARSVDEAISQRDIAAQQLAEARVTLERARVNLDRATVRAPFTGQIVERLVELGEYVGTGSQVARLVDTVNVEVRARVPVSAAPYLAENAPLTLDGPGMILDASVTRLVRVGNEVTRTFEIRLTVPADRWVIGTAVRVSVPTDDPRAVVAVPRDALVLRRTGAAVFKINAQKSAERVAVETGAGSGSMIEVRGALLPGDRVVVRGAERLQDGQAVSVIGSS